MAAIVGYVLVVVLYRWFPADHGLDGLSLLAVAVAEAVWGASTCGRRSTTGEIGAGAGRLHPLAVARVGDDRARRRPGWGRWCSVGGSACSSTCCRAAASCASRARTPPGAVVAALSALALVVAGVCGFNIAASPRRSRPTTPTARRIAVAPLTSRIAELADTRSDLRQVQSAHDRTVPRRPGSAQQPQAGMAALDGVAGARHRGQFRTGVHQPGGAAASSRSSCRCGRRWSVRSSRSIYRRQSDADQAKARDLKMVYDLQLDREISARREYELNVESHLRRELAGELRAQSVRRGRCAAGRTGCAANEPGDSLRHRPCAPPRDRDGSQVRGMDRRRGPAPAGSGHQQPRHRRSPRRRRAHRREPHHRRAGRAADVHAAGPAAGQTRVAEADREQLGHRGSHPPAIGTPRRHRHIPPI